jgi:hypothetical protein
VGRATVWVVWVAWPRIVGRIVDCRCEGRETSCPWLCVVGNTGSHWCTGRCEGRETPSDTSSFGEAHAIVVGNIGSGFR